MKKSPWFKRIEKLARLEGGKPREYASLDKEQLEQRIRQAQDEMRRKSRDLGGGDRRGTNHRHPPGPRTCPKCGV